VGTIKSRVARARDTLMASLDGRTPQRAVRGDEHGEDDSFDETSKAAPPRFSQRPAATRRSVPAMAGA
jgi:hypothetical protein